MNFIHADSSFLYNRFPIFFLSFIATSNEIDPLCKLVADEEITLNDQYYRLCVAVSRSSYFINKVKYPVEESSHFCRMGKVSFKTREVSEETKKNSYYERMILCPLESVDRTEEHSYLNVEHVDPNNKKSVLLYISRAYQSNQVFVYLYNFSDQKIYLENLSTNICVVDELNSFDFVED